MGRPGAKTITWYDPAALAAAATELPGREFLQAIIDAGCRREDGRP